MNGDEDRHMDPQCGPNPTPREGRHHTRMDMHHIHRIACEKLRHMVARTWMDWKLEGQVRRHPVNAQTIHLILAAAHLSMTRSRREYSNIMTRVRLCQSKGPHLGFDTAGPWQVAVRDMGDPHKP